MSKATPHTPDAPDESTESINPSRFIVINVGRWSGQPKGWHPLVYGLPPEWATAWGDNRLYGPWVEVGKLRFLWHTHGFWFCEVSVADSETLSSDQMSKIGATYTADEEQKKLIQDYAGYKNRVGEVKQIAERKRSSEEAKRALIADMYANPGKYPTIEEAQHKFEERVKKSSEEND